MALRLASLREVVVRTPYDYLATPQRGRAPRRCGGCWSRLAQASGRRSDRGGNRAAPRRQVKLSKKQQEEHMRAALRPTTESFVGYSPQMQKMTSSQLAQVHCCRRWAP